jgi:hypothetical protein
VTKGARVRAWHHAERESRLTKGGRTSLLNSIAIRSEGSMHPLVSAPPAAPLPRRSEAEGRGGLVVLLLAERAPSEGPRSTRAFEVQPGHLLGVRTS